MIAIIMRTEQLHEVGNENVTVPGEEECLWQKAGHACPDECLLVASSKSFQHRAGWKGTLTAAEGRVGSSYLALGCSSESFPAVGALLPLPKQVCTYWAQFSVGMELSQIREFTAKPEPIFKPAVQN